MHRFLPMPRLTLVLAMVCAGSAASAQPTKITGVVTDGVAPLEGAIVCGMDRDEGGRVAMATAACAVTDESGAFEIDTTLTADVGQIVAGAEGYRTADLTVSAAETVGVALAVERLDAPDDPGYAWWRPTGNSDVLGCGTCHSTITDQWSTGRHALAADNPNVLQLYERYQLSHDDAGECGACHAATASWSEGRSVDLNEIPAEHAYGVSCESCHKVRAATPGAEPGALGSLEYWRPGDLGDAPFAFGPYPNVLTASMRSSYSPLFREAALCAGCHEYTNPQGVAVMDTFTDWQAVGNPESTTPCQGCHMEDLFGLRPGERLEWLVNDPALREEGAQRRDAADVARHEIWGGVEYAAHALDLLLSAGQEGDVIAVSTTVMNIGANHRVPTGMPFREMILVVSAEDDTGAPLALVDGPQVGARGGDLAAEPGRMYAKSLADEAGNLTFAFWDATELLEDTRLATGAMDDAEFRFAAPARGSVHVTARLLYRRFSQILADAEGWDTGEQELYRDEDDVELEAPPLSDAGPEDDGDDAGTAEGDAGPSSEFQEGCVCRSAPASPRSGSGLLLSALGIVALLARRRGRGAVLVAAVALGGCLDLGDTNMDWTRLDRPVPPAPVDATVPDDAGDAGLDADGGDASAPAPRHVDVLAVNLAFSPPHVRVAAGGSVTWYNLDPVQHDVRSGSPELPTSAFNSGLLDRGDPFTFVFETPGAYEYYCSTHASVMRGATVEVVEEEER